VYARFGCAALDGLVLHLCKLFVIARRPFEERLRVQRVERSRACATLRSASSTSPAATTSSPSEGGSCQMVTAPLAVQSFAPYPQSEQHNVGLDRLVTLQRVLAHKGVSQGCGRRESNPIQLPGQATETDSNC
jgi:hypothetical protein